MELNSKARGDRRICPLDGAHIPDRGVVDRITGLFLRNVEGISLTQERGLQTLPHRIAVAADAIHDWNDSGPGGRWLVVGDSRRGVQIGREGAAFESGD